MIEILGDDERGSISLELWIDEGKRVVLNDGYFRELRDLHIDGIAVMIDTSDREWKSSYSQKDIERLLRLADLYSIEVILTVWPYPSRVWMADAFAELGMFCRVGSIAAIEGDLEFNWTSRHVQGFRSDIVNGIRRGSLDLAGDVYVEMINELHEKYGVRREMTTFTSHTENGRAADVAPHMDCLLVQAYAVRTRPDGRGGTITIPWVHSYGPGHMQKMTFDRTMFVPGVREKRIEIGYGHAIWNQEWPDHTPEEAMNTSFMSAISDPIKLTRVRCWSSKHRKLNKYATPFLRSLHGKFGETTR